MPDRQLQLTIRAIDQATEVLRDVREGITGVGEGVRETAPRFTELNQSIQLLRQGAQALADVYEATIGQLVEYANEVSQLSSITGESTENASRLLTVLGDFGIGATEVATAMRTMRTEGLTPTLATLAALSDQYRALEPGIERINFLQETLGRSGAEWARAMEMGGDALLAQADAVAAGNVLTEQEIAQAIALQSELAGVHDAWSALTLTLAQAFAPAVEGVLDGVNALLSSLASGISIIEQFREALGNLGGVTGRGGVTVPVTLPTTSGRGGVRGHQTGGPVEPITLVGEQGQELIINGVVVPHEETERLLRLGLVPDQEAMYGGGGGGIKKRPENPATGSAYVRKAPFIRSQEWSRAPGIGEGGEGGAVSPEVAAAVEQTSTETAATVLASMPAAIAQAASEQSRALVEEIRRSNDETNGLLRQLVRAYEKQSRALPVYIRDAVERTL